MNWMNILHPNHLVRIIAAHESVKKYKEFNFPVHLKRKEKADPQSAALISLGPETTRFTFTTARL